MTITITLEKAMESKNALNLLCNQAVGLDVKISYALGRINRSIIQAINIFEEVKNKKIQSIQEIKAEEKADATEEEKKEFAAIHQKIIQEEYEKLSNELKELLKTQEVTVYGAEIPFEKFTTAKASFVDKNGVRILEELKPAIFSDLTWLISEPNAS